MCSSDPTLTSIWVLRASRFGDSKILSHRHMVHRLWLCATSTMVRLEVASVKRVDGQRFSPCSRITKVGVVMFVCLVIIYFGGVFIFPFLFSLAVCILVVQRPGVGLLSLYHLDVIFLSLIKLPLSKKNVRVRP